MANSPVENLAWGLQKLNILVGLLAVCLVVTTLFLVKNQQKTKEKTSKTAICGNSSHINSSTVEKGKELFLNNCASCHSKNMFVDMTGPALSRVAENWSLFPKKDLFEFIRHPKKSIASGQPRAVEVWKKCRPVMMNDFPDLADDQIESILAYIRSR